MIRSFSFIHAAIREYSCSFVAEILFFIAMQTLFLQSREFLFQQRNDFSVVFDDAEAAVFEDRRVGVNIDRGDVLGVGNARHMLARAANRHGDVQTGRDLLARLADLPRRWTPS